MNNNKKRVLSIFFLIGITSLLITGITLQDEIKEMYLIRQLGKCEGKSCCEIISNLQNLKSFRGIEPTIEVVSKEIESGEQWSADLVWVTEEDKKIKLVNCVIYQLDDEHIQETGDTRYSVPKIFSSFIEYSTS